MRPGPSHACVEFSPAVRKPPQDRAARNRSLTVGLERARAANRRLGRPPMPMFRVERIRDALMDGKGVRETARLLKVSAAKVSEIRRTLIECAK